MLTVNDVNDLLLLSMGSSTRLQQELQSCASQRWLAVEVLISVPQCVQTAVPVFSCVLVQETKKARYARPISVLLSEMCCLSYAHKLSCLHCPWCAVLVTSIIPQTWGLEPQFLAGRPDQACTPPSRPICWLLGAPCRYRGQSNIHLLDQAAPYKQPEWIAPCLRAPCTGGRAMLQLDQAHAALGHSTAASHGRCAGTDQHRERRLDGCICHHIPVLKLWVRLCMTRSLCPSDAM